MENNKSILEAARHILNDKNNTVLDEAFARLPGHVINGDLYLALRGLTAFVNSQKNGNDVDMQLLNTIIKRLDDIKKEVKKFNDEAEIPVSYQYKAK